jgi:hypothetical protein
MFVSPSPSSFPSISSSSSPLPTSPIDSKAASSPSPSDRGFASIYEEVEACTMNRSGGEYGADIAMWVKGSLAMKYSEIPRANDFQ